MWRRKMAARFSEEDGHLNTGKGGFHLYNTSNELVLNRSHEDGVDLNRQSGVDHSILAIFEDSGVPSENKNHVEEDSERLLSALTEMLDRVGEDEDGTFSPFDVVPNTKLLGQTLSRDDVISQELSPSRTLRPRPKPPNGSHQTKPGGEKHQESKVEGNDLPKTLEAKVEVFTPTSLISLVNLMHPYCLKLQVEKEDKQRRNLSLFSQEEVWRYEQPTEEGDEEINVVSEDDEAPVKQMKVEDKLDKKTDKSRCLKSVLLNGNSSRAASSRERKRVSFGPVHVTSFDESEEEGFGEKKLNSGSETKLVSPNGTKAPEDPESSTPEFSSLVSERSTFDDPQDGEKKSEMKAKSLSLQEYRKLRQNRRPLVEKQGNYTTKWPSIAEPPKELTPILCFQGQKDNAPHPDPHKPDYKTSVYRACLPDPPEDKPPHHQHRSRSKGPRTESKVISPASPLLGDATNPNVTVLEAKRSPVKKTTLLSTDPPNPVLLPLPVPQTSTASSSSESRVETVGPQSSRRLQEIRNESSAAAPQTQAVLSEPKPRLLFLNKDLKLNNTALSQGVKASSTTIPPDGSSASPVQTGSASECKASSDCSETKGEEQLPKSPAKPKKCPAPPLSQSPPLKEAPVVLKGVQTRGPSEEPPPAQTDRREPVEPGIEAPDLTSLLEQFEETQAIEDKVVQNETKLHPGSSPSSLQTDGHVDLNQPEAAGPERTSRLQLKPVKPHEASSPSGYLLALLPLEPVNIPEPLCTEVVLSSQQDHPARRKNPPSKSIQIIDPRPLPPKKIHTNPAESLPTRVFSYLSFDHDYCRLGDLPPGSQSSRAKSSSLTETSKVSTEQLLVTQDSRPAEGGQKHTSDDQTSEQLWTSSEVLQFSSRAVMEDVDVNNIQTPPSILPTPPPSPPVRGREKRRYRRRRSPRSDSSSSSSSSSSSCASCSPKRQRIHHRRSESSSCSSSPSSCVSHSPPRRYRLSYSRSRYSRSRSRSWSRSPFRSRSPSPPICCRRWREVHSSRESRKLQREHEVRIQKLKAIDERRVVYVGRIRRTMTHNELRERFSQFGEVECVSLHFRDRGDHYGFVTFYTMEDAFAAIDNGGKLRGPDELPFDICFGGRRQFCNSNYADLDANREAEPSPTKSRFEDLDFDSLLKQAQRGQKS